MRTTVTLDEHFRWVPRLKVFEPKAISIIPIPRISGKTLETAESFICALYGFAGQKLDLTYGHFMVLYSDWR